MPEKHRHDQKKTKYFTPKKRGALAILAILCIAGMICVSLFHSLSGREEPGAADAETAAEARATTEAFTDPASMASTHAAEAATEATTEAPPVSVSLTDRILVMEAGDSWQLELAEEIPDSAKLTWSSDDSSCVRVDEDGEITARQEGHAVITASAGKSKKSRDKVYVTVIDPDSFGGNTSRFPLRTGKKTSLSYQMFKQNARNYDSYNWYLTYHGCATCTLATVLGAYSEDYADIEPDTVIDTVEKDCVSASAWRREHVTRSLKQQMPLSLYGISSILEDCGVENTYVRSYTDEDAEEDILAHLKTGNAVIFEVGKKNRRTGKSSSRWTNSYHTMALLGVLTNGKVLVCDAIDRSWYDGGDRLKVVELSDVMAYMFPCTEFSESMYYDGAASDGGYIKVGSGTSSSD